MQVHQWKSHNELTLPPDCGVRACREYVLSPGEETCAHAHPEFHEVHLVLEGAGDIVVGSESRTLAAGEIVFVTAGVTHLVRNTSNAAPLRALTLESTASPAARAEPGAAAAESKVSIRDLDEVIESIPEELDVSLSLQLIIKLFDMAGNISEQIDQSLGLETESGYEALRDIEKRVMEAVVVISDRYHQGGGFPRAYPRRF